MNQHRIFWAVLGFALIGSNAYAEGGIKLTPEARMHPLMQAGFAFDSNPHRSSDASNAVSDGFMLIQGGLEFTLPSDRLDIRMNNIINYHHYLGLESDPLVPGGTARLSTVKGGSAIQLLGNRKGKFRWGLAGKLNRMDEPEPLNLGVRQGRWSSSFDGFTEWRPGGGALGLKPAVGLAIDSYDESGGEGANKLDKSSPTVRLDLDWRFLPRTQFVINNHWTTATYANDPDANGYADPVSSEFGVMGQVSPRLSAIIAVGYSGSQFLLSDKGEASHTVSGQAEIRYDERRKVTWRLGVRRRLLPVTVFGFMADNSAYARYSEKFLGGLRVVTQLKGSLRTFGAQTSAQDVISIASGDARADITAGFDANILWQPQRWWVAGLTNRFEYFTTNSQFKSAGAAGDTFVDPGFGRNLTMLVFEAKY
jgi:hypothetical protein